MEEKAMNLSSADLLFLSQKNAQDNDLQFTKHTEGNQEFIYKQQFDASQKVFHFLLYMFWGGFLNNNTTQQFEICFKNWEMQGLLCCDLLKRYVMFFYSAMQYSDRWLHKIAQIK